jgi:hypothetical protein
VSVGSGQVECAARLILRQGGASPYLYEVIKGLVEAPNINSDLLCQILRGFSENLSSVLNKRDPLDGRTLVHVLAERGGREVGGLVKLMLASGASETLPDARGVTVKDLLLKLSL